MGIMVATINGEYDMNPAELLADVLTRSFKMMSDTLADFSDADMLVRPCPGANHAAWQVGHLAVAEAGLVGMVKEGLISAPPAEFAGKFTKETCGNDDAAFFPRKAALLEQFGKINDAVIAWARTLKPADLEQATQGRMAAFVPTTGHVLAILSNHIMMHMGQFQVTRRKLGKPILF
jgi:DinB family protein